MQYMMLRSIAQNGMQLDESASLPVCETAEQFNAMFPLDEAYFGREKVAPIQAAMEEIREYAIHNPMKPVQNTKMARDLESAVEEVFGVRKAHIYWSNGFNMAGSGPCTYPSSRILNPEAHVAQYGQNSKGFYDTDHRMELFIEMDQVMFTGAKMTAAEAVAVLLHETGHNFDFSPWTIVNIWYCYFMMIINIINYGAQGNTMGVYKQAKELLLSPLKMTTPGRYIRTFLAHWVDMAMNIIPPIGTVVRIIGMTIGDASKFIAGLIGITMFPFALGMNLILAPYMYLITLPSRKRETFADTFCASYGYASEQLSALNKLMGYMAHGNWKFGPFSKLVYDLTQARQAMLQDCGSSHGSNQRRAMLMLDKLDKDAKDPSLSPEARKAVEAEVRRMRSTYNDYINARLDKKEQITSTYLQMANSWYNGKPYMMIPNDTVGDNYAR